MLVFGKCKLRWMIDYIDPTRSERTFTVGKFDEGRGSGGWIPSGSFIYP
jgi:hypothetical protein